MSLRIEKKMLLKKESLKFDAFVIKVNSVKGLAAKKNEANLNTLTKYSK